MDTPTKPVRRARRMRNGARHTIISPTGGVLFATLFGVLDAQQHGRYLVFRQDRRGTGR